MDIDRISFPCGCEVVPTGDCRVSWCLNHGHKVMTDKEEGLIFHRARLTADRDRLREVNAKLLEAYKVIPAIRLRLLADWFDLHQVMRPEWSGGNVQRDLRQMAELSQAAIAAAEKPGESRNIVEFSGATE